MEKSKPYDDCKINHHAAEPKAEGQRHWDRDDPRMTNQWPPHQYNEGQSGNENRSQYHGQMAHQNTGVEKRIEQDMEIGYEDKPSLLTLETLEKKFHDEIMKLGKDESDAEDAENKRHKEKKTEISNQYLEKLTALRVLQAKQREGFLYKETQEQLNQYHHQQQENYTSGRCSPGKGGNHGDQNTMVKDIHVASTHVPTPTFVVFGEPPFSYPSPSTFMFGSTVPTTSTGVNSFQFSGQHSQPSVQNPNPFGQQSEPGLQNPNPFGQPSVQNPNPFGQLNQPGVQNPNPFGQQNQPSVQNPNPFGQQNQPGLQNSNPFGQQNQPSVQNPNPFGQQNQPSVQNPNPFGQQNLNQFAQQSQPGIQIPNPFCQQSLQNPNPFESSGSQDFGGGGGNFLLGFGGGFGGGERSGRRIVRVKK